MALESRLPGLAAWVRVADYWRQQIDQLLNVTYYFESAIGNIGSPTRMDYTAIGNHVNLASRLADDAGPGEILITERTLALLPEGLVTVESAGQRNLKGVQRPITLYRIV